MPREPKKFIAYPFTYHHELTVTIIDITNLGLGVAKVTQQLSCGEEIKDWVVFVPYTLTGEEVKIRIYRNDKTSSHADLLEIIKPSPDRIQPRCFYFGSCGGCQYQHLDYRQQLILKRKQITAEMQKQFTTEIIVNATIPSPNIWHYRSKITPHFKKPQVNTPTNIGFLATNNRSRIVDVARCEIAREILNEKLTELRKDIQQFPEQYKKAATLLLRHNQTRVETSSRAIIQEQVGLQKFQFLASDFFQNNTSILPACFAYLKEKIIPLKLTHMVDTYCGSGLFAITLADLFQDVVGIEISPTAIAWAEINARQNQVDNVRFIAASAEKIFQDITSPADETLVVMDPPRKGASQDFIAQLLAFSPANIVYISCNPNTQVRDLQLITASDYAITEVQPVDFFPHTRHAECIVILQRNR